MDKDSDAAKFTAFARAMSHDGMPPPQFCYAPPETKSDNHIGENDPRAKLLAKIRYRTPVSCFLHIPHTRYPDNGTYGACMDVITPCKKTHNEIYAEIRSAINRLMDSNVDITVHAVATELIRQHPDWSVEISQLPRLVVSTKIRQDGTFEITHKTEA